MSKNIIYNNEIRKRDLYIDIEDRGYQFGDGIYEVVGIYNGKTFLLDEHLERLERSAKEIQLTLPYEMKKLKELMLELISLDEVESGMIYLQVSRGVAQRFHGFPSNTKGVVVGYTIKVDDFTEVQNNGANAILTDDIRWLRCDIKTLNLLPNVLSKQKAVEKDAIEAILHRNGTITEASSSNVFIVKDSVIYTHPANNLILNGITRRKVMDIAKKLNIKLKEQTYSVEQLLAADEVFITATKLDIVPIIHIDNLAIHDGKPGKITTQLLHQFRQETP